ncbi:beta-propeller domain-containing protein [Paraglaciecola aquimarina]|uniref:Beta-propeller domain-containing protein n=1 Tax=Paraglaciecola algarum TaxID=3050085 RepID=A0ABS9DAU1_9ALTE|nr:beta-propeller domain-containing protein [Paraglaciecola sp. G1-23]MCF2948746.1 beta-propeller domain-containing protein [Paraglaciecola sp. G1-23]
MVQLTTQQHRSNIGNQLCLVIIAMIIFTLVACSSDNKEVANLEPPRPTFVPEINEATSFSGPLIRAGQNSVGRFIRNGIYSATNHYAIDQRFETAVPVQPTADQNVTNDFSTTNTQEVGVDEADRIKYNGDTLYIAADSQWHLEQQVPAHVRVLERQTDFSLAETAELPLTDNYSYIDGLYEQNEHLAVLSNTGQIYTLYTFAPEPWLPLESQLLLDIYDTSIPASPLVKNKIKIDGTMLSSRRIGDYLYIVNGYTASVNGLNTSAASEKEQLANYLAILDTPDSDLMPKIYIDGDEGTPLNQPADCMIPQQASEQDGYAHLLTILRINMTNISDISSSCISAVAEVMYMSTDNLYLTSTSENQTILHKISLDSELTYQATGAVDGVIGWRSAPNLRLSEYQNSLRIVSSDYSSGEPIHKLSVLQQDGDQLEVIGTLPNEAAPEPIGKPGEDIYAVRFFADRGYIVTFERIDPLYVIDLALPTNPKLLGELEIPGFSNYLHPLDNGYLLGVGQQVNPRFIPEEGDILDDTNVEDEPVSEEGMKVSLFDITDPSNPVEVNNLIYPQSYTPVEHDYRALTVLNTGGSYKLAMPLETWGVSKTEERRIWWTQNSLLLLEVDTTSVTPELIQRNKLTVKPETEHYIYGGQDRSVIHGQEVYYIHGNQVWHSQWVEGGDILGPY